MKVLGVTSTDDGPAVLLGDDSGDLVLPIMVGGTEALSIAMRHAGRARERPLTHDLLEAMLRELGGALVKVQVDELRGTTFIGTAFVRRDGRVVALDARPSDAIALAVGSRVPIFVARPVVDTAAVKIKDASPLRPDAPPRPDSI
jgi:bifunctional DNase/RNase